MQARYQPRTFHQDANVLAFPLGGIGTGNISLGARGDLRDWEIFNAPNKGFQLPNTFFAIWAQSGQMKPICKVLEGPISHPHNLSHGYHPWTASGLPRLDGATFHGEYPFATVNFEDADLPVAVQLEAFTPFIPLDPNDSGLPCAILSYTVENTSAQAVQLSIVGSLINPVGGIAFDPFSNIAAGGVGRNVNEYRDATDFRGMLLNSEKYQSNDLSYGDLSFVTTHPSVTQKRAWLRGGWYDFLQEFWNDFSADGKLDDLAYDTPSEDGKTDTASLGLTDILQVGEKRTYRFVLSWFFPNRAKSWRKQAGPLTRNHYATRFGNSWEVAEYVVKHFDQLEGKTRTFQQTLFNSSIPSAALDAISANIVPLRSATCFWLEDGNFYGYEGCFDDWGCCDGTCTHVWSYAQTLAYLFPSLERNMRRTEFTLETEDDGYMAFRAYKPFAESFIWPWGNQKPEAAVDGQMGSILRVLREWKLSADKEWLEIVWPGVKRAISFAGVQWDTDMDGVLDGRQHNTYDIEFYGPNPLSNIYYLAGLRATEELAGVMNEPELAQKCRELFERSSQSMDQLLWNGEYYIQNLDDVNQHKYQHGQGCLSDQLLGQLYARILNLGDLVPLDHVRSSINAIFKYNFRRDFKNHINCQRTYVLNDEAGLVLCSWPQGEKPLLPFVYSDEVWTGIEYQVAAHLIYEGFLDEALEIITAVQSRHDGKKRNPWDEVECGHHYARSMSSWALMLAYSGFRYDAAQGSIAFSPAKPAYEFYCFFSTGSGWGGFQLDTSDSFQSATLEVQYGFLPLTRITLPYKLSADQISVLLGTTALEVRLEESGMETAIVFNKETMIREGEGLTINFAAL